MEIKYHFALGLLRAIHAAPAAAGSSLPFAEGGYVPDFLEIVREYNASGDEFRTEGVCKSACTIFLGIRNVCVERDAKLMFHAATTLRKTGPARTRGRAARHLIGSNKACGAISSKGITWIPTPTIRCQAAC
jgi:hypothetical protein